MISRPCRYFCLHYHHHICSSVEFLLYRSGLSLFWILDANPMCLSTAASGRYLLLDYLFIFIVLLFHLPCYGLQFLLSSNMHSASDLLCALFGLYSSSTCPGQLNIAPFFDMRSSGPIVSANNTRERSHLIFVMRKAKHYKQYLIKLLTVESATPLDRHVVPYFNLQIVLGFYSF